MEENWRKMKILPSEQMQLLELLKKYGYSIVNDEIEHLKQVHNIQK